MTNKSFTIRYQNGIIRKNRYLEPIRVNEDEEMLDPFLNRYYYNKGRVRSNTKGYESW